MSSIYLSEIMTNLHSLDEYKMHFAKSDGDEPLDVYMANFDDWKKWNSWSNGNDDFNRKYIFSLINFYHENDTWLFGGIWEVVDTDHSKFKRGGCYPYTIKQCDEYSNFIGRLKIKYAHKDRQVRNLMENYFPKLEVKEILEEPYSIETFPGYKNLDVSFMTLENAIKNDSVAWKSALQIRGIYLITDTSSGKIYVGKASGQGGFWQRWSDYIADGHGGDVDLKKLIEKNGGIDHARKNYKFTLLEIVESCIDSDIDDRENYWKRVLLSRMENVGHNKN